MDDMRWFPHSINSTVNKFTAIGCDTYAVVEGAGYNARTCFTGCMSFCSYREDVLNGSCSGIGCCQTSIPNGARQINITLASYFNHSRVSEFNPCSYSFLVEDSAFQFFSDNLTNIDKNSRFPVVVDWVVATNVSCAKAKKNQSSYACKTENSECYDDKEAIGYRCRCKDGFEGNPYLPVDGCQDISECATFTLHNCANDSACVNTLGGYTRRRNQGYHGNGRKDGKGCIADQPPPTKNYWPIFAGTVLGMLFLMAAIFTLYKTIKKWQKKKRKEKFFKRNGGLLLERQLSGDEELVKKTNIFTAKELNKASDGFNPNRVLGEGGQGTVYKGILTDGRIVAIKKSKRVDKDQLEQFINEVIILSQVIHRNVVNLLGCCLETEVPLLVYEFIPNGTLFSLIHSDNEQEFPLTWSTRLRIAQEVASALAYLHPSISTPIFHKDIKTSNILMDEKHRAKVSDFGTSSSVAIDKTYLTTRVQGTFGYIDPEFFETSQFTDKSDVYSFGVVLIELLTRRKPISTSRGDASDLGLVRMFLERMEESSLMTVLDPHIIDENTKDEVIAVAKLGARCVNLNGRKRPSLKEVATGLENIRTSKLDS